MQSMDGNAPYKAEPPVAPPAGSRVLKESQPVHSTADYANFRPPKKRHTGRVVLVVLIIIVALSGAAAAYWFLARRGSKPPAQTAPAATGHASDTAGQSAASAATKSYTSQNFNLSFSYPATWAVTDNGDGKLTAVSPATKLTDATGQTVSGKVIMTIQSKQTSLPAFKNGSAVAALESQKIAYAKPTASQRAQTYLSFLVYAGSAASGIDGIYITGNNGYQKGQTVPQSDVVQVDPLVTVSFTTSSGAPLTLSASAWGNTTLAQPVTDMLKSLAFG